MTNKPMSHSFVKPSTRPDSKPNRIKRKSNIRLLFDHEDASCCLPTSNPEVCPSCGKKGKPVAVLTARAWFEITCAFRHRSPIPFAVTVDCEVSYFSDQAVFTKPD